MEIFKTILLAVDGSAASSAALEAACVLAQRHGGTVYGRYVRSLQPHLKGRHISWTADTDADDARAAQAIAEDAEREARGMYGISLRVLVVFGDPIEELLRAADEVGADSLVIGNRGHSALSTVILGSVAQGVTERSRLPVLVVHERTLSTSTPAPQR